MRVPANGFEVDLPTGWEDRSTIALVAPARKGAFATNVVVTRERLDRPWTVEQYAKSQAQAIARQIPGVQVVDERTTTVDGVPAFQRLQHFTLEGRHVQQAVTWVLSDGVAFAITCSAAAEDFEATLPQFRKVVQGFRLSKPETVRQR